MHKSRESKWNIQIMWEKSYNWLFHVTGSSCIRIAIHLPDLLPKGSHWNLNNPVYSWSSVALNKLMASSHSWRQQIYNSLNVEYQTVAYIKTSPMSYHLWYRKIFCTLPKDKYKHQDRHKTAFSIVSCLQDM